MTSNCVGSKITTAVVIKAGSEDDYEQTLSILNINGWTEAGYGPDYARYTCGRETVIVFRDYECEQ